MDEHTDDLWNVNSGDTIDATLTNGETLRLECGERTARNADPQTGEIRESTLWILKGDKRKIAVNITNGLRSSPDDPEFPVHNEAWDMLTEKNLGYIEEVSIYGEIEA